MRKKIPFNEYGAIPPPEIPQQNLLLQNLLLCCKQHQAPDHHNKLTITEDKRISILEAWEKSKGRKKQSVKCNNG
jgi:hypothetical protein